MSTIIPVVVPVTISGLDQNIPLRVVQHEDIAFGVETSVTASIVPRYEGDYNVTPAGEAQILSTSGKLMTEDITVGAIPSNYGLITWNGGVLTVS